MGVCFLKTIHFCPTSIFCLITSSKSCLFFQGHPVHISVSLSNQFFSNHDKNIFLSTKVFYSSEYFGDIFRNIYLEFLETNPIVQYLLLQMANSFLKLLKSLTDKISISVCNFLVHDKCLKSTTNPCVSVAATIVKVSHKSHIS